MENINLDLISFIEKSPTQFQAVDSIKEILNSKGFTYLKETDAWNLSHGKYYTVRNNSSIIAFEIPTIIKDYHFQLCSSHLDSPTFKVKAESELNGPKEYLRLNVEKYGGAIHYTWLDKPLSLAGRLLVKEGDSVVSKNISIDEETLIIPSVPIHMNRDVNKGMEFNPQVDMIPMLSCGELKKGDFIKLIADYANVDEKSIVAYDLYLVNKQAGKVWGYKKEFVSSAKLDDLQAAYTSLMGFVDSNEVDYVKVYASFDNEEVGSLTKQGAQSTFLKDVLKRINTSLNKTDEEYHQAIAKSFNVSFDNAHALHPNHPEKYDDENRVYMNKGIVIKENASQKYTTDAFSRSIFKDVCQLANVPYQYYANRSDQAGGSTLGNISNSQVSMHTVDIGLGELAMHSSYETAGSKDTEYAYSVIKQYYSRNIQIIDSLSYKIN